MCGIAGWVDTCQNLNDNREIIFSMTALLEKRGPDSSGYYMHRHALLGHRRLAVVDPEGGNQPMTRSVGGRRYTLVYNGELYNTDELRAELESCGHHFCSYSDTEVLLTSYIQWRQGCLSRLNGIFAFAIWDETEHSLFMARDPLGVKPLFYSQQDSSLLFASEIKALLAHPRVEPRLGETGLLEIFALGPARSPGNGIFEGISELPPACYLTFARGNLKIQEYWRLQSQPHQETLTETVDHVRHLLIDAVERQLVSDVPVCAFLSGGLDSTGIAAIAANRFKDQGKILETWSVDYRDNKTWFKKSDFQPDSDGDWAYRASKWLGTSHNNVIIEVDQLAAALREATLANDMPGMADIDSSLWLFCQAVREQATVALSGECADEVFGGYPWYWRPDLVNATTFPWSTDLAQRQTILAPALSQLPLDEYAQARYQETISQVNYLEGETAEEGRMRELFLLNLRWFMLTLLNRKDRMSMANSLEVRVPFADHRLVEYAFNIPWAFKYCDHREKGLLRRALRDLVPAQVLNRKKSPYPKTHNPGYTNLVATELDKLTAERSAPVFNLVDRHFAQELAISRGATLRRPWFGQLMTGPQLMAWIIQLNTWLHEFNVIIN